MKYIEVQDVKYDDRMMTDFKQSMDGLDEWEIKQIKNGVDHLILYYSENGCYDK